MGNIRFDRIRKAFGPQIAVADVSFSLELGKIHGIVGENGAGKTTLMNILSGLRSATKGRMFIDEKRYEPRDPDDAAKRGIVMVHQHFMLVDDFSVLDNILLGTFRGAWLAGARKKNRKKILSILRILGLEVDLQNTVRTLTVAERQMLEIAKAIYRDSRILILDEPTAVLAPQEVEQFFQVLRELNRERHLTILLITHKLREIKALTESVVVMRGGRVVFQGATSTVTTSKLANLMVGENMAVPQPSRRNGVRAKTSLSVFRFDHVSHVDARGVRRLNDVTFNIHAGEIVGIAGVAGNGQRELAQIAAAMLPVQTGRVALEGKWLPSGVTPRYMRRHGVGYVPEDRLREAVLVDLDAQSNSVLGYLHLTRFLAYRLFVAHHKVGEFARGLMRDFDVRPREAEKVFSFFSGGNQQKLVIGRELRFSKKLLIAAQPTRGVDIGAMTFIHQKIRESRDEGSGVLLISSELEELYALADRIIVMFHGEIMGETTPNAPEKQIGAMMMGQRG